jgi:hypothetical protein
MADLKTKTRQSLGEMRILVLGIQLLIGFQFTAFFQTGYSKLDSSAHGLLLAVLACLLVALAMVMVPIAYNRVVERGRARPRLLRVATAAAGVSLLPLALALGGDVGLAVAIVAGTPWAIAGGTAVAAVAVGGWYGIEMAARDRSSRRLDDMEDNQAQVSPLKDRITFVLTEARVVLPGTQAMLGFQFTAMLSESFAKLPPAWQAIHLASLLAMALAIIALMAPAAFHRLAEQGEQTERVHSFASAMVLVAMALLAGGLSGDVFIVAALVVGPAAGLACAVGSAVFLLASWFAYPLLRRRQQPGAGGA